MNHSVRVFLIIIIVLIAFLSPAQSIAQTQLLNDPSFSLPDGWTRSGDFYYDNPSLTNCDVCPGYGFASGADFAPKASLDGTLQQTVILPLTASSAALSFYSGATLDGSATGSEELTVYFYDYTTSSIYTVDNIYFSFTTPYTYHYYPVNSSLFGHTVALAFHAHGGSTPTTIRVDETSLTYVASSSSSIDVTGSLNFGNISVGSTSEQTMTITNTSSAPITVYGISYPAGFSDGWSGIIDPWASQNISVMFSPSVAMSYVGTISINSNASTGTNSISCSGIGTSSAAPVMSITGSLSFGNVPVGGTSPLGINIANTGSSTLNVSSMNLPSGFSGEWTGNINSGGNQYVAITFSPSAVTTYSGAVQVVSNAGTMGIPCSGVGVAATSSAISLTGMLDFGNVEIGESSIQVLTIKNSETNGLNVSSIDLPAGFNGHWSGYIGPGSSQSVAIEFLPTSTNLYAGNITVYSDAASGTNTIYCSGTGVINSTGPNVPSGLTATSISSSAINLTWNAVSNATNYYIYTCDGAYLATTNTNSYSDNGLSSNTFRSYEVAANNSQGCSAMSACQGATTDNTSENACINIDNDYPFPYGTIANPPPFDCNSNSDHKLDHWNFWAYTCTSWVAWKINQEFGTTHPPYAFSDTNVLDYRIPTGIGIAGSWESVLTNIPGLNIEVDNNPAVGSIAWYDYGALGGFVYGHVAFVNCVIGDEVDLTEYNAQKIDGATNPYCVWNHRTIDRNGGNITKNRLPTSYIHIEKLSKNGERNINSISIYPNQDTAHLKKQTLSGDARA